MPNKLLTAKKLRQGEYYVLLENFYSPKRTQSVLHQQLGLQQPKSHFVTECRCKKKKTEKQPTAFWNTNFPMQRLCFYTLHMVGGLSGIETVQGKMFLEPKLGLPASSQGQKKVSFCPGFMQLLEQWGRIPNWKS